MALDSREAAMGCAIRDAMRSGVMHAFGMQQIGTTQGWWVMEAPMGVMAKVPHCLIESTVRWVTPEGRVLKLS